MDLFHCKIPLTNRVRFQFTNQSKFYFLSWWFLFDPTVFKSSIMYLQFISFNVLWIFRFLIIWLAHSKHKFWMLTKLMHSRIITSLKLSFCLRVNQKFHCRQEFTDLTRTFLALFCLWIPDSKLLCLKSFNKVQIVNHVLLHSKLKLV